MKTAKNVQYMCLAAVLCAIGILVPMISPIKITLGPMSFTLASHVAVFVAMFISPAVGATVAIGAALGFLLAGFAPVVVFRAAAHLIFVAVGAFMLAKKPAFMHKIAGRAIFGIFLSVIHGISEAAVVTAFYFGGMELTGTFAYSVLFLVGGGTFLHSMIDYYLALLIWRVVSKLDGLNANFKY